VETVGDQASRGADYDSPEVARAWRRSGEARSRALAPATELMLELAGLGPGSRVLDVGAGTGEQTLLAARRVGPGGMVLAVDIAASMLELAEAAAREMGLSNVTTRVMDAQQLELESGSFDAVIARSVLMLLHDSDRALAEIRRALRPDGRLAAIVFSTPESNPYASVPPRIVREIGRLASPESGSPGMFALGGPGVLESALRRAGFREVEVRPVRTRRRFGSVAEALHDYRDSFPSLLALISALGEAEQRQAWVEIEHELRRRYGSDELLVEGEVLVGAATK
jgi:ubiquinone/menaquinone biosynthesis C-methylase UbiE